MAAVVTTACQQDYDDGQGGGVVPTDSIATAAVAQGEVALKLKVKVPGSLGNINDYYFHNEYTISRLEVWFFDAATKAFITKTVAVGLTQEDTPYDQEYDITYMFDKIRLRAGVYDIFAIANYDHAPDTVADETELLEMVDGVTYSDGVEASMPDKGPVMTSRANDLLGVDLIPWINKTYVLTMEMERVVAKLQIGVSQNTFQLTHGGRTYAALNITNYKLVNLNRQYYLFQHRDSTATFRQPEAFEMPWNYSDYHDDGEQYVVDPLFYQKTPERIDATLLREQYRSWFGAFTTENFASMPSADNYGYAYILENTTFKSSQKNGYSPGVVFKAAVSPTFVYLYDNQKRQLKEEYRPEYWPKTIYLYQYNFYGSIQAVNAASGQWLDELQTYSDAELKPYNIKQCHFNMGVYETYYTYWIRHRRGEGTASFMGPMSYGVVRNNFYKMVVTGVTGLGHSVITPNVMADNYPNSYLDM